MKTFIEQTLRETVHIEEYKNKVRIPLLYAANYHLYAAKIHDTDFLLAEPLGEQNLVVLRKQQRQLERMTGVRCVLYLKKLNYYAKDKLLEEGIPFIWENKQIYLPFLGVLLQEYAERTLLPCTQIAFLTQKLLLTALYDNWQEVNVTKAAERLGVAKTSITRVFDELEALEVPCLKKKARARLISCAGTRREMWEIIAPYMRSPLIYQYELAEDICDSETLGGMSALSYYSMLEDNTYTTYAVTKKNLNQLQLQKKKCVPQGTIPKSVVQELGYMIPFGKGEAIDPLTVYLLMAEEAKDDPRIGSAIDEMLEEYVWCRE